MRAGVRRQLVRVRLEDAGQRRRAAVPACAWLRPTSTGLPNVDAGVLVALAFARAARASSLPGLLRELARRLARELRADLVLDLVERPRRRRLVLDDARRRSACSGATSIASVLRLPWIDSGENSACTNFGVALAERLRLRARDERRGLDLEVERLRRRLPGVRLLVDQVLELVGAAANFCAAFCCFRSASICAFTSSNGCVLRRLDAGDLDDVPAEIGLHRRRRCRRPSPRTPRPRTA